MESLPPTSYIAAGAVVAALISGFWSLINLAISKDQKISEFRQNWIDSLRQEFSDHIGQLMSLASLWEAYKAGQHRADLGQKFIKDHIEIIGSIEAKHAQIILRLNPEEHKDLLRILDEIDLLISSPKSMNSQVMSDYCVELRRAAQALLKGEWERVKAGEKSFRYFRNGSWALVIAISVGIIANILFNQ